MSGRNFRELSPVVIGIISIVGIVAGTIGAFYIDRLPFVNPSYEVTAEFANAAGIVSENQVRVAGVKVGTVEDVSLASDRVRVTMKIENGVELPEDAFASIKLATLLGTKFIDIEAAGGGEELLEDGDVIPLERTSVPFEIYEASNQGTDVLEGLDGDLLNKMLVQLAKLVETSKEELGVALEGLNELGEGLAPKGQDLESLFAEADDLTKLLSDEGDHLNSLIDSSNDVLGSLAAKREEIQSLLSTTRLTAGNLEGVLKDNRGELDSIFEDLHRALVVLDRNVANLDMAFEYAGPSSRYFGSIFSQGRWGDIYTCALILSGGC